MEKYSTTKSPASEKMNFSIKNESTEEKWFILL